MLKIRNLPFEEDIEKATDEKNLTEDWAIIMHICDNATNYQDGAKFCFKAIMKRLHHNVPRVVLQTLTLLDACVKNCDRKFLLQVASCEFTNEVRKLLPKMHPSTAVKLKELIQKWSMEEFKDDPELCIIPSFYYKLVSEGVEFPPYEKNVKKSSSVPLSTNPDAVNSQEEENDIIKAIEISLRDTGRPSDVYGTNGLSEGPPREAFKVRVLFDFEAAEDNELTIKAGEIALVVDNSNPSWWKGTNHRGEGLFPSNFVTEDLDRIPEEPVTVPKEEVREMEKSDDSIDAVVVLDEKKIELAVEWLNDTDPTGDDPDPEEMLALEREVHRMAPLIEEQLQIIDNRLAMLSLVNQKIVEAFDTFHSLSSVGDKYATYDPGVQPFPQMRFHTPMAFPVFPQPMQVAPPSVMDSAPEDSGKPSAESVPQPGPVIGYYMNPGSLPFPMPLQQGLVTGQPDYAPFPYAMAMMGPYFRFPGQYINSSATPVSQPTATTTIASSVPAHNTDPPKPPVAAVPQATASPPAKTPSYSQDLQNLTYAGEGEGQKEPPPPGTTENS